MKNLLVYLFLLTITDSKLIFVNVAHRHGDRTPVYVYPTDPYPESFWTNGLGILTNLGKNELYDLGKFMRSRYSGFLPLKYHDANLHVEASAESRVLMSAYCSLTALYEPHGDDIWSPIVKNWQPIPVYSVAKLQDNKINNKKPCPRYDQLLEQVFQAEISEERKEKYKEILKNLSYYTGLDLNLNLEDLNLATDVYDSLLVEDSNHLKLPGWTADFYPEALLEISNFLDYELPYYNKELKRLRCGPLLKEMMQHFEEKIDDSIEEIWWQYSGHDSTVAHILNCLNVYDGDQPVHASAVFLELYQNLENNYDVALVYRKNQNLVQNLIIPNCTLYCPLEKFKELIEDVIPINWEEECKLV